MLKQFRHMVRDDRDNEREEVSSGERLLIIGLGNPLMGDDGAGIEVVHELMESGFPEYVDVIDGGTPGVGLIDLMSGYNRVIVVDAVRGEDGIFSPEIILETKTLPRQEIPAMPKQVQLKDWNETGNDHCSLHETELTSVLKLMQTLEMNIPEITIVGIPVVNIGRGIGLSEECRLLIPQAVKLIKEVVDRRAISWSHLMT